MSNIILARLRLIKAEEQDFERVKQECERLGYECIQVNNEEQAQELQIQEDKIFPYYVVKNDEDLEVFQDTNELVEKMNLPKEEPQPEVEEKPIQEFNSADTSINKNKVPALHTQLLKQNLFKGVNFDNGAGKWDSAQNALTQNDIENVRYDPYNLPDEVNNKSNDYVGKCDTSTLSNVLNVIKEEAIQKDVIQKSYDMLRPGGVLYISIYEGDGSGEGRETKKNCWQNNKKTKEYIPVVEEVFGEGNVTYRQKMIIATKSND